MALRGRDFLLGTHGSPGSRSLYTRRVAEWLANDRQLLAPATRPGLAPKTVNDLYISFQHHADQYYRRADGTSTSEADNFRDAIKPVL